MKAYAELLTTFLNISDNINFFVLVQLIKQEILTHSISDIMFEYYGRVAILLKAIESMCLYVINVLMSTLIFMHPGRKG